jgi:peroxiredoxin Q/BCP
MAIEQGDAAPDFSLPDDSGGTTSLGDFEGKKLIMYFYPKAFTPGCTTQACDFRDNHEAFLEAGYEIVGVSPDAPDRLAKFKDKHKLPFTLVSDEDHSVAAAYGAWGTKKNYGREYEGLIRSTFIVDEAGTVQTAWRNVKATGHGGRVMKEAGIQ